VPIDWDDADRAAAERRAKGTWGVKKVLVIVGLILLVGLMWWIYGGVAETT
jgi:hypothetical protein